MHHEQRNTASIPEIPTAFLERYRTLVDDPGPFQQVLQQPPRRSFRVNTLKAEVSGVVEQLIAYGLRVEPVAWSDNAFVLADPSHEDQSLRLTFEQYTGQIQFQELASMLPPLVLAQEIQESEVVLDACAAPGSKSTQVAALMRNRGVLITNDRSYSRIRALKFNLERAGVLNDVITNYDLLEYPDGRYPIILLDAPCSGDGTGRKNPKFWSRWNEAIYDGHASLQRRLILKTYDLLAPGGVMVYSTCSMAPEENEAVIDHLLREREAEPIPIDLAGLKTAPGVTAFRGTVFSPEAANTLRVWPHFNDTDGFYLAKVRKP